jgi:hypothetical protein
MKKRCSVPGCQRRHVSKGYCSAHYQRHRKGLPLEAPIVKRVYGTAAKRLRARVRIDKLTGCHLWTGFRNSDGYGQMRVGGVNRTTHRIAWEAAHGPIPEGMVVMHTCDNPPCCNPAHLKLGTPGDNVRDRIERGRGRGARARDLEQNPQWASSSDRQPRIDKAARALRREIAGRAGLGMDKEAVHQVGGQAEQDQEHHQDDQNHDGVGLAPLKGAAGPSDFHRRYAGCDAEPANRRTSSRRSSAGASAKSGWRIAASQILRPIIRGLSKAEKADCPAPARPGRRPSALQPGCSRHARS